MGHLAYLAVLLFIVGGTIWLEFTLRTRVLQRFRRLALAVLPVVTFFVAWDAYAISQRHWTFDTERVTGWLLPLDLPIEEVLFFFVIPVAAILTYEAVRSSTGWLGGDERDEERQAPL
jgi:lycopene cyclase domain-containing protein